MAEYHVGCGAFEIYAGTLNKSGSLWRNKSKVTNEAINAVASYMYLRVPEDDNRFAYGFKMKDGKYVRLMVEVSDKCPDWAKEAMGEQDGAEKE